ncbi:MAG: 2-oxo acid dehydrogenase subunit E2, partial [Planctomycetia bacterium]|nr:2-oxo acid dehydrogenase subunit E2 [Planctomycetia bacterium]
GQIVAGHTLCLSLTFDHRIVDGAPAAKWLSALCAKIVSIGSGSTLGGEPATVS